MRRDRGRPEDTPAHSPAHDTTLTFQLPAQWASASLARERIEHWLRMNHWPSRHDIVFAVSEAVSNSVEHGYRITHDDIGHTGIIEVYGQILTSSEGCGQVEITVRDYGRWRPDRTRHSNRRRGIAIISTTMEHLTVNGTDQGTTVTFRSPPIRHPYCPPRYP